MKWFIRAFNNAEFEGRARRREYWIFHLVDKSIKTILYISFNYLGIYLLSNDLFIKYNELYNTFRIICILYILISIPPNISVTVRRLHDTNRSGWLWFMPTFSTLLLISVAFTLNLDINKFYIILLLLPSIIFIYWMSKDSDKGDNKYGISPKYSDYDSERILTK